jgi:hypothetical protein
MKICKASILMNAKGKGWNSVHECNEIIAKLKDRRSTYTIEQRALLKHLIEQIKHDAQQSDLFE